MLIAAEPVPPLGGHPLAMFLVQVVLLLLVATLLGRLAARCSLPPIVGELMTGVVLGPSLLGHTLPQVSDWLFPDVPEQAHLLDATGQFGVLLLVGLTGLQMDTQLIRRRAATAVRVSLPGFVIPLGLGITAGCLLPAAMLAEGSDRTVFAAFLGIAMCVSAIPVIAKTLMDLGLLHRNVGQLILISGTVDDVLGWLGLSVVTAMATSGLDAGSLVRTVVFLLLFLAGAALIGRPLVNRTMRATARSAEPGVTLGVAVALVIAFSAITHAIGFEAVFGALAAGVLIRGAGKDVLTRLAPLRTFVVAVLAPLFFATAGLRMDLTALADPTVLFTALVLLAIAVLGKFAGAFIGAWASGLSRWEAIALGAGMNARGVVEVIVAMVGLRLGVLNTAMYTVIVLIAVATSLMGPPILRRAVGRIELTAEEELRRSELRSTLHKDDLKPVEQA
ncbi:cation:proton antiporter [Streptomyces caeruleatus]|uniref:Sodium:proton exchanger n=1 Tax=Streptomyces caeruleatus TaxID=661399 RepID=A0A101TNR0_9ACTN|nr:cation:proton antiporter [Streptomyces caeruleatus]KUN95704.1 sodium:proton exchanger [Streptomyces caeruleatus]